LRKLRLRHKRRRQPEVRARLLKRRPIRQQQRNKRQLQTLRQGNSLHRRGNRQRSVNPGKLRLSVNLQPLASLVYQVR
jgi:hypothetical protein